MPQATSKWDAFLENTATIQDGLLKAMKKNADYTKYVNVKSTKKQTEREQDLEGMRAVGRLPESAAVPEMDFSPGWAQAYTQGQWAGRVCITIPMQEFSMGNFINTLVKRLRLSTYQAKEIIAATYLEFGDTAIASVPVVGGAPLINSIGGDGLTLFNTAHTFRSDAARTWTNKAAAYADLTPTAINTVYVDIAGWKDNNGAPLEIDPSSIIYPVALRQKYLITMKSLLDPATANNAINASTMLFSGGADAGLELKWLTSTADWYVKTTADQEDWGLKFYFGFEDMIRKGYDPHTLNYYIAILFSIAHGANALRSIYAVKEA